MTKTMTMLQMLDATKSGRFFSCCTIKRTTRLPRTFCCKRAAVPADGPGMAYDPTTYGLLNVWDRKVRDFRMVNLRKMIWVNINGTRWVWNGSRFEEKQ